MMSLLLIVCAFGLVFTAAVEGGPPVSRIVGGVPASLGEFPHQISLQYIRSHTCGGSIIHPSYILTAGHCVYGRMDPKSFVVVSGTISLQTGGTVSEVDKITLHEKYNPSEAFNDLAIIKLKVPIVFNDVQKSISLPKADTVGTPAAKFSGWGLVKYPGITPPTYLQKMDLHVVTNKQCQDEMQDEQIHPEHICAFNSKGIGACSGDSGGPLIIGGEQVGVVSWVHPLCALGDPDVYVRVFKYLDWIHNKTDNALNP